MADRRDPHDDHDPLLVAALLDGDLAPPDRIAAEAQVADCTTCADLHADLVALSSATRAMPTPARPRDFRITVADATRLTAEAAGEPGASGARLTGVMNGTQEHATHDTLLVAALADRALAGPDRVAAERLIDTCSLCARLHADLVAISAATRDLPTPVRPREYALTPADAARLRPNPWRRFIAAFGTSRDTLSRPLAAGLTTLGLAGLLLATLPSMVGSPTTVLSTTGNAIGAPPAGGQGVVPGPSAASSAAVAAAAPAASPVALPDRGSVDAAGPLVPLASAPTPVKQPAVDSGGGYGVAARPSPEDVYSGSGENDNPAERATGNTGSQVNDGLTGLESSSAKTGQDAGRPSPLALLSGFLLLLGLGLGAVRWAARRFGDRRGIG